MQLKEEPWMKYVQSCFGNVARQFFYMWQDNELSATYPEFDLVFGAERTTCFLDFLQFSVGHVIQNFEMLFFLGRLSNMTNLRLNTNCLTALPFSIGG